MTQYGLRKGEQESSMWLKYKGNVMIEWTATSDVFGWVADSDIGDSEAVASATYPFRRFNTQDLQLFLSSDKRSYGMKKADLDIEFSDTSGTSDGEDDGEGQKLESSGAYDVNNTLTVSGYIEADTWRDEQPFTDGVLGKGTYSRAYTLSQKLLMAMNMAKRSGVQELDSNMTHPSSHYTSPITVYINWGYNHNCFNNLVKYLMNETGLSYLAARKQISSKWMPGYTENWNYSSSLAEKTILEGLPYAGTPHEQSELVYSNCVIDDLRVTEDSTDPTKLKVEMRLIFDSNNNRWASDRQLFNVSNFSTAFANLLPDTMVETAPTSYIGPQKANWL